MKPTQILNAVEPMDHDQRWRHMIELGRKSRNDPALAATLKQLADSPSHYERLLALMSVSGSFDLQLIAAFLSDPSSQSMSSAIALAARHLPDDTLVERMPTLTPKRRQHLARELAHAWRHEVNDRVYPMLDEEARRNLLPYTSSDFISEHLDADMMMRLGPTQWARLVEWVPSLVKDLLVAELGKDTSPSWLIRMAVVQVLHRMWRFAPEIGRILLAHAVPRLPIGMLPVARYAQLFPEYVVELLKVNTGGGHQRPRLPASVLARLPDATVCDLAEAGELPHLTEIFSRLRPSQRALLYARNAAAWREHSGALPIEWVEGLPMAQRHVEARRAFDAPLLASRPMERLPYLGCLPFEDAASLAGPFLAQPEGELRAQAVAAVVNSGRYQPAYLDGILDFALVRKHEQDPVRASMIGRLAELPPSRWQTAHLPKISEVIAAALRARDCSLQTMMLASQWLVALIIRHTDFVVAELPVVIERTGHLGRSYRRPLQSRLGDREMMQLAPTLLPLLRTWIARGRAPVALDLIAAFGCRVKVVPAFAELMIELTGDRRSEIARPALAALLRADFRREAAELIPRLLAQDPSWIQVHTVAQHLHQYRQSLLNPFLSARVYSGRFKSGSTAVLVSFQDGFARWTAHQQQMYADSLRVILTGKKRNAWELYSAMARFAAMPSVDLALLVDLARLDAKDAALRDKALEALGRADAGRGVPALLEALDDARARVAIYALRRALSAMPSEKALALLAQVPRGKVTVAKEVVRLAGEVEGDAAYAFLSEFARAQNLHPDVRIALLRAFWRHLDRDEVWTHFREAAVDERAALARATIRIPQEGLSVEGRRRLGRHLALLLQHPDAQVKRETLERLVTMPLGASEPEVRSALFALLEDIDPAVALLAARALLELCCGVDDAGLAHGFARIERPRSLEAVVEAYVHRQRWGTAGHAASAALLIEALRQRRWQSGLAAMLAVSVLEPDSAVATLSRFAQEGLLHPGAVSMALGSVSVMNHGHSPDVLRQAETALHSMADVGLRRIGLGLLLVLVNRQGWREHERAALDAYRADAAPWVSEAANLIEPPPPASDEE